MKNNIKLRPLEKKDLHFIHQLANNEHIMSYWFEEPYESFDELEDLYKKHIHDHKERRFIAENDGKETIGIVELVNIHHIHRTAEFQIIIAHEHQGKGYAQTLINLAINYSFVSLNLRKVYLIVDEEHDKAIHLYKKAGFIEEGRLIEEYFAQGKYHNVIRMYLLKRK